MQLLDGNLIRSLIDRAQRSPRRRTNHNFHASMEENPHRFLNAMVRGTYIAPFRDDGEVATTHILGRDARGVDVQPGIWHTVAVLTPHAVCYEVKPGPYSAANDKDFAPWAPREGDAGVTAYLAMLVSKAALKEEL